MYSEHLENIHPGWVVGGWLVALAVTSAAFMVFVGIGLTEGAMPGVGVFAGVAMAVGFFVGGLFVGLRWTEAPILHGVAITLVSVLVWLLGNLLLPDSLGGDNLELDATTATLTLILVQLVAACGGGWMGRRLVMKGGAEDLAA